MRSGELFWGEQDEKNDCSTTTPNWLSQHTTANWTVEFSFARETEFEEKCRAHNFSRQTQSAVLRNEKSTQSRTSGWGSMVAARLGVFPWLQSRRLPEARHDDFSWNIDFDAPWSVYDCGRTLMRVGLSIVVRAGAPRRSPFYREKHLREREQSWKKSSSHGQKIPLSTGNSHLHIQRNLAHSRQRASEIDFFASLTLKPLRTATDPLLQLDERKTNESTFGCVNKKLRHVFL